MEQDPEMIERRDAIIDAIRREFGFVPVVNQVVSERPDVFVPLSGAARSILEHGDLDRKTRYLCAVSAATAIGGEYCVDVQMRHAKEAGATKDEVFEAIMIGSYMAMTRAQSYALRRFAANYGVELDDPVAK